jgi:serine/threonine protein phosphatase PrpC
METMSHRHRKLTLMPQPAAGLPAADDPGLPELVRLDGASGRPQRWSLPSGSPGRLQTRFAGATDIGMRRGSNEDAFVVDAAYGLFVVCDGVGGRPGGEIAARTAASAIREHVRRGAPESSRDAAAVARVGVLVRDAIVGASLAVRDLARSEPHLEGMRTTASVVLIAGDFAVVGQVGDSRVYLGRGASVRQLTEDHTLHCEQVRKGLVAPDAASGRRSPITRVLGRDEVEVDVGALPLAAGDRLLLCSDGLHGYLADEALKDLFRLDVRAAAPAAIDYANALGGEDNITALFVELVAG